MKIIRKFKENLTNVEEIEKTIDRLIVEEYLPEQRAISLKNNLSEKIKKSEYVLFNLAVQVGIQAVLAYEYINPLPIATMARTSWALGNRIYYQIRRNKEKIKVHSGKVILFSCLPYIGFLSYLIPLKEVSEDLPYVYANHLTYNKKGKSLEKYLEKKPKMIRNPLRRFLIPKDLREKKKIVNRGKDASTQRNS
jgi:hypothetical protein